MLPKISSCAQLLIANLRAFEAKVSGRGMSRPHRRGWTLGALLGLIFFVAVQPSESFSEAAYAFGQWGNGGWAYGSAYNHRTQSEAQIAAMNTCNQRGYNCAIRDNFRKMCFAIAVQDNNNGWGTGYGDPDVANRQALLSCAKMGLSCSIREEFCDSVSEAEVQAAEQAEYQQYVQNWNVCFGRVVTGGSLDDQMNYCDYALRFPRAIQPAIATNCLSSAALCWPCVIRSLQIRRRRRSSRNESERRVPPVRTSLATLFRLSGAGRPARWSDHVLRLRFGVSSGTFCRSRQIESNNVMP